MSSFCFLASAILASTPPFSLPFALVWSSTFGCGLEIRWHHAASSRQTAAAGQQPVLAQASAEPAEDVRSLSSACTGRLHVRTSQFAGALRGPGP
jgi:hypothetical protein